MLVVRPIESRDLEDLLQIAHDSGHGFTSLPINRQLLAAKIERSQGSLSAKMNTPGDQSYLFVLYDAVKNKVVGTAGIEAAVGLDDAFYHYHLSKVVHSSRELNIYNTAELLTLCNDYTGSTEICSLYLAPQYREGFLGKLLSKSRLLFMAQHPQRFSERIFAEMRGVSDNEGISPFWRWLDKHFFTMDFPTADYLTGIGKKQFIAELMPKYPIYVNLLSSEAQVVIGQVHENTKPALNMLQREGFCWRGYVDIFDAGPTVECPLDHIRSVTHSLLFQVEVVEDTNQTHFASHNESFPYLVVNCHIEYFRAGLIENTVDFEQQKIYVTAQQAALLFVQSGDKVRILDLSH